MNGREDGAERLQDEYAGYRAASSAEIEHLTGDCVRLSEELDEARATIEELRKDVRDAAHWEGVADRMRAEIERLSNLVHLENGRADSNQDEAEEYKRLHAHAASLYEMFRQKYDDEGDRSERYRLAWLSARRRAARESEFAAEALALKDAEIARLARRIARLEAGPVW